MANPRPETPRKVGFAETVKQLFKAAAKALTVHPKPTRRRSKSGEGAKGFERLKTKGKTRIRRLYSRLADVPPPWDAMAQQRFWGQYFWADQEHAAAPATEAGRPLAETSSTDFAPKH